MTSKPEGAKMNPPDHINLPTYPCSCNIEHNGKVSKIKYCSVHNVAHKLLQAVKDALLLADLYDEKGAAVDNYRAVIAKAEGR